MKTPMLPMVVTVGTDHVRVDVTQASGRVVTYLTEDIREPARWQRTDLMFRWRRSLLSTREMLAALQASQDIYHYFAKMETVE